MSHMTTNVMVIPADWFWTVDHEQNYNIIIILVLFSKGITILSFMPAETNPQCHDLEE